MITAWTKNLKDQSEIDQFNNKIIGSKPVLERLSQLISEMTQALENEELDPRAYDKPNWDYRQAHANGYKAALRKINKLISLDQAERN